MAFMALLLWGWSLWCCRHPYQDPMGPLSSELWVVSRASVLASVSGLEIEVPWCCHQIQKSSNL